MESSELTAKHLAPCSKPPLNANERGAQGHPGSCVWVVTSSLHRMYRSLMFGGGGFDGGLSQEIVKFRH